jgi:hypothetical protein
VNGFSIKAIPSSSTAIASGIERATFSQSNGIVCKALPFLGGFAVSPLRETFLLALASIAPECALSFQGPLPVRNGFPLAALLDAPYLERAVYEDFLSFNLTHSSVDFIESDAGRDFRIDLETTELTVRSRKTVPGFCEFGIDVRFLSFNGGFLGRSIVRFHQAFGIDSGKNEESSGEIAAGSGSGTSGHP